MTPTAPTWAQVEEFLDADGWRRLEGGERGGKRSRHVFYEKTLDNGRVLQTHISHSSSKAMSPGRFSSILHHQLEVSQEEFWACIRSKTPVNRPVALDTPPVAHEAWVIDVLVRELHLTAAEIASLSPEEAQRRVHDHWAKPL